ncbi:integral membrane protein [Cryptococcus deuterogattii 99/473]|uniref:Glycerophosphocholine acyltransferase 1 n=1 Tax=Cryptococcus deuterogattii Ram5 TaxID=1296110 RepID=A0A0D0V2P9_9TREE|nr:integral membrane protein [Cryptococcus deuterogattii LA55]KIR39195.1 integral membrane protein [Cryptococcus deuterogattii Ram5]KIR94617.1 integral membrane protein [Cryptococcus deuterogattii CBS 10090]KIY57567.1 integral membrane protein [Cryptococcus deuterogattii 99/473]
MPGQAKNTSPGLSRQNSSFSNLMALNLDRYGEDWAGALTLLVEMLPKQLRTPKGGGILLLDDEGQDEGKGTERNKSRGEKYKEDVEREVERIKIKLAAKVTHLSGTWKSEQVVRTKDKVSFLFGVLSLAFTCLLYGMAPEWFPVAYTVQAAFYMPIRIYTYHRKAWHYFLFGPLASAIITWRNSLVFHSLDKVTSIFIHIYPPIVLTVIRHVIPNAEEKYSGLKHVGEYKWYTMILLSSVPYILWQGAYYKFISVDRKSKIESGERQNSFRYLLNDKRGPIGKALQGIRPEHRELWFIFGQLIYSIIFMIPPSTLYIHSSTASSTFLVIIFTVSAWNGATFYVEVFGRKFERELEKLRKEMEVISATMTPSTSAAGTSPAVGDAPISSPLSSVEQMNDAEDDLNDSPLILPDAQGTEASKEAQIPDLNLGKAVKEIDNEAEDQATIRQRKKA